MRSKKHAAYLSVIFALIAYSLACLYSSITIANQSESAFDSQSDGHNEIGNLELLEDPQGKLNIDDILNTKREEFLPIDSKSKGLGFTDSTYWFRFSIDFSQYSDPYWYLVQNYEHISYLTLFYPSESTGEYVPINFGSSLPIEKRQYQLRNFVFKVPTPNTSPTTYYLRADSQGKWLLLDLTWTNERGLVENVSATQFVFGLFFGGLSVMLIYNLFLYLSLKDKTYIFYVYYLTCFIGMFIFINGYSYLVFDHDPKYSSLFTAFMHGTIHAVILTVRSFFNLKKTIRKLDQYLKIFQYLSLCSGIASLTILSEGVSVQIAVYVTIGVTPLLFMAGILRWKQGLDASLYYLAGWTVFSLASMVYVLQTLALLPSNLITTYGIQLGAVWESVLFALALAKRTKDLKLDRDRALAETSENRKFNEKVIKVLENERKLISQEIHDNFNANLLTIKLSSQKIAKLSSGQDKVFSEIHQLANNITAIVIESYKAARELVQRFRPEHIDTLGLAAAMQELVENYNSASEDCEYSCEVIGNFDDIAEEYNITCYRIAQEAITNTVKHSAATRVKITLLRTEKSIYLTIEDNGRGFNPRVVNSKGVGLISMRERSLSVGGKFNINSSGSGTRIEVILPLSIVDT